MSTGPVTLRDESNGSSALVLAGFGFNCCRFQAVHRGRPLELLWSDEGFAEGGGRPSGSGIPLLFPFPGRARGGRFSFQGKTYDLEPGDGRGNAIHGFVLHRPWEISDQTATRVQGTFQASKHAPELLRHWPADFRLQAEYELDGNALTCRLRVENPDDKPLPWGLGTHPYFRLPLVPGGEAGQCQITVPASEYVELADMLPTGKELKAAGPRGLAGGMRFGETQLDDVFTDLAFRDGRCTTTIHDPLGEATLSIEFDNPFTTCVVYNPPHREAICIEPYTCVPGMLGEGEHDAERTLAVLKPGDAVEANVTMRLDAGLIVRGDLVGHRP